MKAIGNDILSSKEKKDLCAAAIIHYFKYNEMILEHYFEYKSGMVTPPTIEQDSNNEVAATLEVHLERLENVINQLFNTMQKQMKFMFPDSSKQTKADSKYKMTGIIALIAIIALVIAVLK
ncbi:hypothetical protein [Paenibacillus sp. GP183]|uniref:hypothetical protein n=1 Tax=Paenibacillus sp. GP183 TaxID=1882751 RepID=UPI00089BFCFB|nr:hypothetical protein [Paenibacillus sp. GP183]SEC01605.1 hypothetical protein SAMN05443246_2675 [Paenibacillus sp. GP183]